VTSGQYVQVGWSDGLPLMLWVPPPEERAGAYQQPRPPHKWTEEEREELVAVARKGRDGNLDVRLRLARKYQVTENAIKQQFYYLRAQGKLGPTPYEQQAAARRQRAEAGFPLAGRFALAYAEMATWGSVTNPEALRRKLYIRQRAEAGEALRAIADDMKISRGRVYELYKAGGRALGRWAYYWRPVTAMGHPEFDDPYGVDQVFTPDANP
jgi:hypothetical protein